LIFLFLYLVQNHQDNFRADNSIPNSKLKGNIVITGGTPGVNREIKLKNDKICFYNFLDLNQQEEIMNRAKFIISRSGYSTVMDLIELGKEKVLFIPTPGQTEQEYLADIYEEKKCFIMFIKTALT